MIECDCYRKPLHYVIMYKICIVYRGMLWWLTAVHMHSIVLLGMYLFDSDGTKGMMKLAPVFNLIVWLMQVN